jgi:hypothetical protein
MKQKEMLEVQTEVNDKVIFGETYHRNKIANSPFYAVGNDEKGYHLVCGSHRLTENSIESMEEVDHYMEYHKWDIISQLITILIPAIVNENKN